MVNFVSQSLNVWIQFGSGSTALHLTVRKRKNSAVAGTKNGSRGGCLELIILVGKDPVRQTDCYHPK